MGIGQNLMKARKKKSLSQEEVANCLNVSRQSVSLWECDQTIPSLDNLIALSKLYDVSIDILIGQKEFDESTNATTISNEELNNAKYEREVYLSYKRFLILSSSFLVASLVLLVVPVLSTMFSILALVFSLLSFRRMKTNYNLFVLIFSIVLLISSIFVIINADFIISYLREVFL